MMALGRSAWIIGAGVALLALVVASSRLGLTFDKRNPVSQREPSATQGPEPSHPAADGRPRPLEAPAQVPSAPARPPSASRFILPSVLPETPGIEEGLRRIERAGMLDAREFLGYALAYRAHMDRCLHGSIDGTHTIRFWARFKMFPHHPAVGTSIEIIDDGDITEMQYRVWLACTTSFHLGHTVKIYAPETTDDSEAAVPEDEDERHILHWALGMAFPVEDSFVYKFVSSDGAWPPAPRAGTPGQ